MTIYEAAGTEKPNVTKNDVDRLQLIEDQQEAIQHIVWNSPEPSTIVLLVFYAHDELAVLSGLLNVAEAVHAKRMFDKTGEAMVLTMSGPPSEIAKLLRKRKHHEHANIVAGTPPEGAIWVVCVASGGATIAAMPVTPVIPIGSA
jgi:hypothetical protein